MIRRRNDTEAAALWKICLLLILPAYPNAFSQLNSNSPSLTLNASLAESISVSATPSTVTFNLIPSGIAIGSSPVAITTSWVLSSSRAAVYLDGSFANPSAALTGSTPPAYIPSSSIYGLMSTGLPTVFTAFVSNTPLGTIGAGLPLFTQILSSSNVNSSRTDNLTLEINLLLQPQLPSASNYTGALLLQAQAL